MDLGTNHSDPLRDAIQDSVYRAVQVGSFALTATQVYAYHRRTQARIIAEQNERARRALHAVVRAERDADRARWAPALDPAWRSRVSLIEIARAWGAALPYADRNVPWHEPSAAAAMTQCEERLRQLHPYAMAHYDRLRSKGLGPAEAMHEAAPLFARHPQARDASAVPRPVLPPAPQPDTRSASGPAPVSLAGYIRPGRIMRPCDEDFPWSIREVLAAESEQGESGRAAAVPAVAQRIPPPSPLP